VPALGELVVVDEFGKGLLRPASRGGIEFVWKDAHGGRDNHASDAEERITLVLPIETSPRERRIRQPGERDVVEDVVPGEAFAASGEDPCDHLVAARVVIKEISRQADGGIRDSVKRLRAQPHLVPVGDSLLIDGLYTLVSDLFVGGETRWRRRS
jgi:hypothetical protein